MGSDLAAPPPPRSLWQRLYGGLLEGRRRYWAARAGGLPRPVVSVGNLHWGGAGKTPLVAAIAGHLHGTGRRVAILSRGYGGRGKGVRFVGVGEGARLGPEEAGDEPVLLARSLPGVAVVVSPDRRRGGLEALERLDEPPDLFLLDDGFSHLRLDRDVDILAFPAADPFAGGRLAPGGSLREPLTAARRADAVVLTSGSPPDGERLAEALRAAGFRGPGFASPTLASTARTASGEPLTPPAPVLLVCGIARPDRFRRTAVESGFEIVQELILSDHHAYGEATRREILRLFGEGRARVVLTTSKDFVKLEGRLELPLAELPIEARPEEAFWSWLEGELEGLEGEP